MKLRVTLIFALIIFLLSSCYADTKKQRATAELSSFAEMQEHLIHAEEERRSYVSRNEGLKGDVGELHKQLEALAAEVESRNPDDEFIKETPAGVDVPSPADRIKGENIRVNRREVLLDIKDVSWHFLLDTNSMDPLLDEGTNVLAVAPESEEEIIEGDIIIFESNLTSYPIVHRVMEKGMDENGTFFITKGDNSPDYDPKIRFENVHRIVVGILY